MKMRRAEVMGALAAIMLANGGSGDSDGGVAALVTAVAWP